MMANVLLFLGLESDLDNIGEMEMEHTEWRWKEFSGWRYQTQQMAIVVYVRCLYHSYARYRQQARDILHGHTVLIYTNVPIEKHNVKRNSLALSP